MSPLIVPFMPEDSTYYEESCPHGSEEYCNSNSPGQSKWIVRNKETRHVRKTRFSTEVQDENSEEGLLVAGESLHVQCEVH